MSASPDRLKSLAGCGDAASLRSAVGALCLLRLESPAQESELMTSLGASRFGDDVLVIVDLPANAPLISWRDS